MNCGSAGCNGSGGWPFGARGVVVDVRGPSGALPLPWRDREPCRSGRSASYPNGNSGAGFGNPCRDWCMISGWMNRIGALPPPLGGDPSERVFPKKRSMEKTLIRLDGLSKVFVAEQVETRALSNITLEIDRGEFVSIAGPSGCGKTTLLSILGLLDAPTEGRYLLEGESADQLSVSRRARIRNRAIGFVFQAFNLIGDLTVFENVELPLTYRSMPGGERKDRVLRALERVGMAHRVNHYPSQLSGGQQQRAAVARAIVGKPLILLADEPIGNLDSRNGGVVLDLFHELHTDGATICMVTHDERYARTADRAIHLFDGQIVGEGSFPGRRELEGGGLGLAWLPVDRAARGTGSGEAATGQQLPGRRTNAELGVRG